MTTLPPVAVFVRCHAPSLKLAHLYTELSGGGGYDLYLLSNDTEPAGDYAGRPRVSLTLTDLEALGADISFGSAVLHYSDLLFSICRERKPGYGHYVIVEFDVHFVESGRNWMETFCGLLSSSQPVIDMVAPYLGRAAPEWHWFESAAQRFANVMQSFFPVVALSERAILADGLGRLEEARVKPRGKAPIFCEAFLPSLLEGLSHVLVDLNRAVPGSYAAQTFLTHLPSPFVPSAVGEMGRLLHPIKAMTDAPLPPDGAAIVRDVEPDLGVRPSAEAAFAAAAILVESGAAERGMQAILRSGSNHAALRSGVHGQR